MEQTIDVVNASDFFSAIKLGMQNLNCFLTRLDSSTNLMA
mgnify:CR=1 FL=1